MGVYADYNFDNIRNPELQEIIKTFMDITSGHDHDGSNSKSVTAGSVGDGTVTNAKLATDVKVGSLAALTTSETGSVVGAINELVTADTALTALISANSTSIGTLSNLTTSAKTSLVLAINELDADNAAFATKTGSETLTNKTLTSPVLNTALIGDGDAGCTLTSSDQTDGSATATIPNMGTSDTFVMLAVAQTLTNKTLTTPVIASFYQDAGKTQLMTTPNTASDTLAAIAATQTLTNKTLTTPVIESIYQDAGKTQLMTLPNTASDTLVAIAATQTLTNKTLTTPVIASFYQDAGKTKLMTTPDTANDTLVAIAATQTLTNKTLTSPVLNTALIGDGDAGCTLTSSDQTNASATVTIPNIGGAADSFVMLALAQTLTNKTLTIPILTTPKIDDGHEHCTITSANQTDSGATVTIPDIGDSADTFCMLDTTQTLTSKTLTAPTITSPDITFSAASHDYSGAHDDWTLSASEDNNLILTATNADSGVNILAPNTDGKMFVVYNGTGQTLTILVSGQSGVAIANTKTALVRCNGTDYVRVTADA